jgi:hypothetical protein
MNEQSAAAKYLNEYVRVGKGKTVWFVDRVTPAGLKLSASVAVKPGSRHTGVSYKTIPLDELDRVALWQDEARAEEPEAAQEAPAEPTRDERREQAIEQARQEAPTADERLSAIRDRLHGALALLDELAGGDPEAEATRAAATAAAELVKATRVLGRHLGPRCRHCGVPVTWAATYGTEDYAWRHDRGDGATVTACTDNLGRPLASGTVAEPTE